MLVWKIGNRSLGAADRTICDVHEQFLKGMIEADMDLDVERDQLLKLMDTHETERIWDNWLRLVSERTFYRIFPHT